jgi:predicted nucleic acid binding AN1-type Zn finger protein
MKERCCIKDCIKYTSLIGHCSYCKKQYCSLHRLPEDHLCDNLQEIIEKQKNLLSEKLKKEAKNTTLKLKLI